MLTLLLTQHSRQALSSWPRYAQRDTRSGMHRLSRILHSKQPGELIYSLLLHLVIRRVRLHNLFALKRLVRSGVQMFNYLISDAIKRKTLPFSDLLESCPHLVWRDQFPRSSACPGAETSLERCLRGRLPIDYALNEACLSEF